MGSDDQQDGSERFDVDWMTDTRMAILETLLGNTENGCRLSIIAAATGIQKSTISKAMGELQKRGLVSQDVNGVYHPHRPAWKVVSAATTVTEAVRLE